MSHRRIYVASSWRNEMQPRVVAALRDAGHAVYDFRNSRPGEHGFHWSQIGVATDHEYAEAFRDALDTKTARHGFASDFGAMQLSDTCVLVLPCGKSAHLEAGWFAGQRRDVYVLSTEILQPELMYLMTSGICLTVHELLLVLDGEIRPRPSQIVGVTS